MSSSLYNWTPRFGAVQPFSTQDSRALWSFRSIYCFDLLCMVASQTFSYLVRVPMTCLRCRRVKRMSAELVLEICKERSMWPAAPAQWKDPRWNQTSTTTNQHGTWENIWTYKEATFSGTTSIYHIYMSKLYKTVSTTWYYFCHLDSFGSMSGVHYPRRSCKHVLCFWSWTCCSWLSCPRAQPHLNTQLYLNYKGAPWLVPSCPRIVTDCSPPWRTFTSLQASDVYSVRGFSALLWFIHHCSIPNWFLGASAKGFTFPLFTFLELYKP